MSDHAPKFFCIGSLTLDLASGRLLGAQGDIDIRPKTFALLAHLAQHSGQVVPKEALIAAVWPDVIVSEDSLTQCVRDLRRILGAGQDHLLRTFPRRGYMLDIAPGAQSPARAEPERRPELLSSDKVQDATAEQAVSGQSDIPAGSLAVLPFLTAGPVTARDRLLLDGLAHDITTALACMRSFQVIGRGSAFALRDMAHDSQRLRQLLHVDYIVTGHVEPVAGRFRLRLDLVRTDHGTMVWTETFTLNTHPGGFLAAEATQQCAAAVAQALTLSERQRALSLRDQPLQAWEAFHRGLDLIFRFEPGSVAHALDHFATAIELDPAFTRAYAFQSFCHYYFAFTELSRSRSDSAAAALASATTAMHVDELSPTANWAYGRALCLNHDPEGGLRHCARAVELCPSFPHAHYMLGFIEAVHGDAGNAFAHLDRSEGLSPFDPFNPSVQMTRAVAHLHLGRLDKAADYAARAVRHQSAYSQMLYHGALVLAGAGRMDEARLAARRIRATDPHYIPDKLFRALYDMPEDVRRVLELGQRRLEA